MEAGILNSALSIPAPSQEASISSNISASSLVFFCTSSGASPADSEMSISTANFDHGEKATMAAPTVATMGRAPVTITISLYTVTKE